MAPAQPLCLLTGRQTSAFICSINLSRNPWKTQRLSKVLKNVVNGCFNSPSHYTYWKEGKTTTLCSTAFQSSTTLRHTAMSQVSWEGARLNKGKHGTVQGPSPGCCADLAHTYLHTLAAEWGSDHLGIVQGVDSKNLQASSLCSLTPNFFRYTNKKSHSPNK